MRKRNAWLIAGGAMLALPGAGEARLTRLLIESEVHVPPARPGAPAYRILRGRYEGRLDPASIGNRVITDIRLAPRDGSGLVGYSATFAIALPENRALASGILLYDVPNRGSGDVAADPDGHVRVVSGWQGDIVATDTQRLVAPVARGERGRPVTAPVLQRFTDVTAGAGSVEIAGGIGRPTPRPQPLDLDTRHATLTRQHSDTGRPETLASSDWAFADCRTKPFPGTPDPTRLCLRGGFDPALAYTLVYIGRDPKVLGVGFAAVRDLNTFLRSARADDAGTANPAGALVRHAIVAGNSQSGNFVRSFIALGFNRGEDGARVFDGANPNIAGRQLPLNIRFGVPGGAAGAFEAGSEGPLWWSRYDDRARGRGTASLLDRCRATATCPKIMETFGSAEFWGLRLSPNLVGTYAKADLPLPAEVRRYYFPSVTHGGSLKGGFPVKGETLRAGSSACVLPGNPNPAIDTYRALLAALVRWVDTGKAPPASRYPTLAAGDLVPATAATMGWPHIPGAPSPDGKLNAFPDQDFGDRLDYRTFSGVLDRQPPRIRRIIPQLVPRVDADGNETAGIRSVQLTVPIGTYTGWNELGRGYGAGGGCGFVGGFIPFARTRAERIAAGDPRPSLEERYRDHAGFVARVRAAAAEQVAQGWLLPADATRIVGQAETSDVLR